MSVTALSVNVLALGVFVWVASHVAPDRRVVAYSNLVAVCITW
jgi:hypothetical protein